MKHLEELQAKLAAEVAAIEISGKVEAALLREFDARHRRRVQWPWWAAAAIAAGIVIALWLAPRHAAQQPVKAVQFAAAAPQSEPATPPPARVHRTAGVHRARKPRTRTGEAFTAMPFAPPLAPYERAELVQVDMPVSALAAAGIQVATADTGAMARTDFLVGADGTAHAFRLISISNRLTQ